MVVAAAAGIVHVLFSITAASPLHPASPSEAALEAAVVRGIALIGVLRGFTRRVFGLGRAMKRVLVRLDTDGVDPYSATSGFDFKTGLAMLQRALHLADALRARLRTAAVALALAGRRSAPRLRGIERRVEDERYDPADPLWRIAYLRADANTRAAYRQAIADMSDGEVIERISAELSRASAMLGETEAGVVERGLKGGRRGFWRSACSNAIWLPSLSGFGGGV